MTGAIGGFISSLGVALEMGVWKSDLWEDCSCSELFSSSGTCKFFTFDEGLDFSMFSLKVFYNSITFLSFSFLSNSYSCSNVCESIFMSSSLSSNSVFSFLISKFFCSSCRCKFVMRFSKS